MLKSKVKSLALTPFYYKRDWEKRQGSKEGREVSIGVRTKLLTFECQFNK